MEELTQSIIKRLEKIEQGLENQLSRIEEIDKKLEEMLDKDYGKSIKEDYKKSIEERTWFDELKDKL